MITRDNQTRGQLNQAARQRLKRTGALPRHGVQIALSEYAAGDRVIARRNDRGRDIDNGTLGTVVEIDTDARRLLVRTDSGQLRALDYTYVARHVQHAYALTAHGAQGATVTWAAVVGRPEDFTRQWAYTALSRARTQTTLHLIAQPTTDKSDREQYAPAEPKRGVKETLHALQRAMTKSELEPLAHEHASLRDALRRPPPQATAQLPHPWCGAHSTPNSVAPGPPPWPSPMTRRGPRLSL